MIPYLLALAGGYLIGTSRKEDVKLPDYAILGRGGEFGKHTGDWVVTIVYPSDTKRQGWATNDVVDITVFATDYESAREKALYEFQKTHKGKKGTVTSVNSMQFPAMPSLERGGDIDEPDDLQEYVKETFGVDMTAENMGNGDYQFCVYADKKLLEEINYDVFHNRGLIRDNKLEGMYHFSDLEYNVDEDDDDDDYDDDYAKGGQIMTLYKGDRYRMPSGVVFVIGDKIKDEWGTAIELINEKTGQKFVNDLEKAKRFLQREKAHKIVIVDGVEYGKGGTTHFRDKVKSISKRLVGTKVPKRLKKDYGATYDKKESIQAAQRIAGSMLKKEKLKKYE